MSNSQPVCGNCGEPVAASDITCPHCDALLAAYASPAGSTTAHVYDPNAAIADAFAPTDMRVPPPAAPIVIPTSVDTMSSAPRPLFDTSLTVEDIARAAESEHDEPLVVVTNDQPASASAPFAVPDYARPPADAAPVPLLEDVDAASTGQLTARPARTTPSRAIQQDDDTPNPSGKNAASPPPEAPGESWLYDLSRNAPTPKRPQPVRERKNRPEPVRTTTLPPSTDKERGRTEDYLRKLHQQTGYDGNAAQLSQPVDTRTSWSPVQARRKNESDAAAKLEKSRMGCSNLLIGVLFFMWLGVIGGMLTGDLNPGLFAFAVVLTFLAIFLRKPFPTTRQQ